jgi:hypothetical protein
MSDGEALEELAAAMYHVKRAEGKAESEKVSDVLLNSLDFLDDQTQEILLMIGEQEYEEHGSS